MASILDRLLPAPTSRALDSVAARFQHIFGDRGASDPSGIHVDTKVAMGISAFYACVRNISEDCAKMPIRFAKTRPDGGSDAVTNHPALLLLNRRPNQAMTAISFREAMFAQALTNRSAFAEIVRDGAGKVTELWPLDSDCVEVKADKDTGALTYFVKDEAGQKTQFAARNILHIHGVGCNGVMGWVATEVGKTAFGKIIAAQMHAAGFFGNNAVLSGVLEAPPQLTAKAIENLRSSFTLRHGGPDKAYKWAILPDGVKAHPLAIDPEKSQLIEAIYQGVEEVCRFYRMPPNKVQHLLRSTYSNIAEENQSYATDTLQPWCERFSQEVQVKILGANEQNIDVYFDDRMFLESDAVKRTDVMMKLFQMGQYSIDEMRIEVGLKPIGGEEGSARFVMANVQSVERAIAEPAPSTQSTQNTPSSSDSSSGAQEDTQDAEDSQDPMPQDSQSKAAVVEAFRIVFAGHFARMIRVGEKKVLDAQKRGKLHEFQADYRKNTQEFVRDGAKDTALAFACANSHDLTGALDKVLNRIAAHYLDTSSDRLIQLCKAQAVEDPQAWAEQMADYAIRACQEAISGGN